MERCVSDKAVGIGGVVEDHQTSREGGGESVDPIASMFSCTQVTMVGGVKINNPLEISRTVTQTTPPVVYKTLTRCDIKLLHQHTRTNEGGNVLTPTKDGLDASSTIIYVVLSSPWMQSPPPCFVRQSTASYHNPSRRNSGGNSWFSLHIE